MKYNKIILYTLIVITLPFYLYNEIKEKGFLNYSSILATIILILLLTDILYQYKKK